MAQQQPQLPVYDYKMQGKSRRQLRKKARQQKSLVPMMHLAPPPPDTNLPAGTFSFGVFWNEAPAFPDPIRYGIGGMAVPHLKHKLLPHGIPNDLVLCGCLFNRHGGFCDCVHYTPPPKQKIKKKKGLRRRPKPKVKLHIDHGQLRAQGVFHSGRAGLHPQQPVAQTQVSASSQAQAQAPTQAGRGRGAAPRSPVPGGVQAFPARPGARPPSHPSHRVAPPPPGHAPPNFPRPAGGQQRQVPVHQSMLIARASQHQLMQPNQIRPVAQMGGRQFTETITIDPAQLHPDVTAIVMVALCRTKGTFRTVGAIDFALWPQGGQQLAVSGRLNSHSLSTGCVLGLVYREEAEEEGEGGARRSPGTWKWRQAGLPFKKIHTLKQVIPKMQGFLEGVIPEDRLMENLSAASLALKKDECIRIIPRRLRTGLGWAVPVVMGMPAPPSVDLDSSVIGVGADGTRKFVVFFGEHLFGNSVQHCGDCVAGAGWGDKEIVKMDLSTMPDDIACLFLTLTIYDDAQTLSSANGFYCRVVDDISGQEICRYSLEKPGKPYNNAVIMACIYRDFVHRDVWRMKAIGLQTLAQMATEAHLHQMCVFSMPSLSAQRGTDLFRRCLQRERLEAKLFTLPALVIGPTPCYYIQCHGKGLGKGVVGAMAGVEAFFKFFVPGSHETALGEGKKVFKSIVRRGRNPKFPPFYIPHALIPPNVQVTLQVWDKNRDSANVLLGSARFCFSDVLGTLGSGTPAIIPITNLLRKGRDKVSGKLIFTGIQNVSVVARIPNPAITEVKRQIHHDRPVRRGAVRKIVFNDPYMSQ